MGSQSEASGAKTGAGAASRVKLGAAAALAILMAFFGFLSWQVSSTIDGAALALGLRPVSAAERVEMEAKAQAAERSAIAELAKVTNYLSGKWHPIHFPPQIKTASNAQCLTCHAEILANKPRIASPAGLKANNATAWYQTLDTYTGEQETFHARHLTTPFAKDVMDLKCTFCHQGSDMREEAPGSSATTQKVSTGNFTLRKQVNPQTTCLMCHGQFPATVMGLEGKWHELREGMESPEQVNGCLTCHAEQFRTVRHQVNYLKADAIEASAKKNADTCFGCHGGRAWYRNSYAYPRHPWPGMDTSSTPDWAKDRASESLAEHRIKKD